MDEVRVTLGELAVTRKRGGRIELDRHGIRIGVDPSEARWLARAALPALLGDDAKARALLADHAVDVEVLVADPAPSAPPAPTPSLF